MAHTATLLERYLVALLAIAALTFAADVVGGESQATDRISPVTELRVEPADVDLRGRRDQQLLLVTGKLADGTLVDLTSVAELTPTDAGIIAVGSGARPAGDESPQDLAGAIVRPVSNGTVAVEVKVAGQHATIPVRVELPAEPGPVSFQNDVMTALTKLGCNSGACHGAASGKNGFKLTLLGYDPAFDFRALTHDTLSRRINALQPDKSLVLLKPAGTVAHQGGKRFGPDDEYFGWLHQWIVEGARSDVGQVPELVGVRVYPDYRAFPEPGLKQQLLVMAEYAGGTRRDVTRHARFSSNNETAALVDSRGLVRTYRKGEAAIMVRFADAVAVSRLLVLEPAPDFVWSDPPENNYVDTHVFAKLRDLRITPSELTTDAEFLRRVYLDTIGLPPAPAEVRAFLADSAADKRRRAIDRLLLRPEFADFWAMKWADLLRIRRNTVGSYGNDKGVWSYYRWVRSALESNMPFDRFVRALITARGDKFQNPAVHYYQVWGSREDQAENTIQLFTGVRLMCAKCHDHPFEKWTQRDYYAMAAFFSQVARKGSDKRDGSVVFTRRIVPQANHPNTGETLKPKYLDGALVDTPAEQDAREVLADWLTAPENPFFARGIVNRVWAEFFGRGIIDPVDDIRLSNPPINAPLLKALEQDFVASGFDLRHLIRTITGSRVYQLSSRTNKFNADDVLNFSHAPVRRLGAEQLLDAISQATGIPEEFTEVYSGGPDEKAALPAGPVRATQLPDSQIKSYFLDTFGRPPRDTNCSCERRDEATMTQALHLINGQSVHRRLIDPKGRAARLAGSETDDRRIVEQLYLWTLARYPTANEYGIGTGFLAQSSNRETAAQDLLWALLNTREFLFNH